MRTLQVLGAIFLGVLFDIASASMVLPVDAFSGGFESWETSVFRCQITTSAVVELKTHTERGTEAISRAVSVWSINGDPFEIKYFEPTKSRSSLSGYRATGITFILDRDGKWLALGGRDRLMNNHELILLRILRHAHLERHGIAEREFTKGFASCNNARSQ